MNEIPTLSLVDLPADTRIAAVRMIKIQIKRETAFLISIDLIITIITIITEIIAIMSNLIFLLLYFIKFHCLNTKLFKFKSRNQNRRNYSSGSNDISYHNNNNYRPSNTYNYSYNQMHSNQYDSHQYNNNNLNNYVPSQYQHSAYVEPHVNSQMGSQSYGTDAFMSSSSSKQYKRNRSRSRSPCKF